MLLKSIKEIKIMKNIALFLMLLLLSAKTFAFSIEFKKSEILHVEQAHGGVGVWTKGDGESGSYIMISETKEGMLKKNMIQSHEGIYFTNVGNEILVGVSRKTDLNDYQRNDFPLWLFIFSGLVILLFCPVLYYCRKYLIKHV